MAHSSKIDVWKINLDGAIADHHMLSAEEHRRAQRFQQPVHANRFRSGRAAMRSILGGYLGAVPSQLYFEENEYGKPFLAGSALRFNLSHSEGMALLAVVWDRAIGVDIERVRPSADLLDIAAQYFSAMEYAVVESLPREERVNAFYHYWTWKEAYIKARGEGLSISLDTFAVPYSASPASLVFSKEGPQELERWYFCSIDCDPEYRAALAVERGSLEIEIKEFATTSVPAGKSL